MAAIVFSALALLTLGWVLYINAKDRMTFEKQLEHALLDDADK